MKKYLKYSGICAALLSLVAFILVMVGNGLVGDNGGEIAATTVIFGKTETYSALGISTTVVTKAAPTALIAWILLLVALLVVIAGVVLPLVKVSALDKFAGVLNLVAVACLVVAGVLFLVSKGAFFAANDADTPDSVRLSGNFVVGAIFINRRWLCRHSSGRLRFLGQEKSRLKQTMNNGILTDSVFHLLTITYISLILSLFFVVVRGKSAFKTPHLCRYH